MKYFLKQQLNIFKMLVVSGFSGGETATGQTENTQYIIDTNKITEIKDLSDSSKKLQTATDMIMKNSLNLNDSNHKELARIFLQELAKKGGNQNIVDDGDFSVFDFSIKSVLSKIYEQINLTTKLDKSKEKIFGFSREQLSLLNIFLSGQNEIKAEAKNNLSTLEKDAAFKINLDKKGVNGVYEALFDVTNDGKNEAEDNKDLVNFKNVLNFVKKYIGDTKNGTNNEIKLLSSISHILNINNPLTTKQGLFDYLKQNPSAQQDFLNKIRINPGFTTDLLTHGKDAAKVSQEKRDFIDSKINGAFDNTKGPFNAQFETAISNFENGLSGAQKKEYAGILGTLKNPAQKESIFSQFKMNSVALLVSLVETKKGVGAGASFDNAAIDRIIQESTNNIIGGLKFDVGLVNMGGKLVPGIGTHIDVSKDLSANTKLNGTIGFINVIPYTGVNIDTLWNTDEMSKNTIMNPKEGKYLGAGVSISSIGATLSISYSESKIQNLESHTKTFKEFLDKLIKSDGIIDENSVKSLPDYNQNKDKYDKIIKDTIDYIRISTEGITNTNTKGKIIEQLKSQYENSFKSNLAQEMSKDGYTYAGISAGIALIAGFQPLPFIAPSFSKLGVDYKEDPKSRLYAVLGSGLTRTEKQAPVAPPVSTAQPTTIPKDVMIGIEGEGIKRLEALFRNFAQNNPKDWRQLIEGNLDFDKKVSLLSKMLNNSGHKNLKGLSKQLTELNAKTSIDGAKDPTSQKQLRDLVAKIFDLAFKDIRSISETVLGYTTKPNGSYEGRFDFKSSRLSAMERFGKSEGLSEFSNLTAKIYNELATEKQQDLANFQKGKGEAPKLKETPDLEIFGFVASYKIDGNGKSLGKGFVEIPAGQVTVVEGKQEKVKDEADKNYIADKFINSEYGKKTFEAIKSKIHDSIMSAEEISKLNFRDILTKGLDITTASGYKINMPAAEFIAFLYGQCANESLGLKMGKLSITPPKPSPGVPASPVVEFSFDPDKVAADTKNMVNASEISLTGTVIGGNQKPVEIQKPTTPETKPESSAAPIRDLDGGTVISGPGAVNGAVTFNPPAAPASPASPAAPAAPAAPASPASPASPAAPARLRKP